MRRHLGIAGLVVIMAMAVPTAALEIGQKAPDFTVTGPGNKPVKLGEFLGKGPVVVYTIIQAFSSV